MYKRNRFWANGDVYPIRHTTHCEFALIKAN